jgi:prepilin signal peptidase PulO-like enzyme (type II secretory pathway)
MQLALPFGPFLAIAAIEYIFFGRAFMMWLTAGAMP